MLPQPGELLHFSEDPSIERFVPHVAATAQQPEAYVWTVDALNSPCYWFPRQCPRVCSWGDRVGRVHAVEAAWLSTMRASTLYAYRFAAEDFEPFGDRPHAHVAVRPVSPLGAPDKMGDLVRLHDEHDIELRVLADLGDHFARVREEEPALEFSAIRMGNAGVGPTRPSVTRR